jgi:hypothetical protein
MFALILRFEKKINANTLLYNKNIIPPQGVVVVDVHVKYETPDH